MDWNWNSVYDALFGGSSVDGRYDPSINDVLAIKKALHKKSTLPYELIDVIVDLAEYWPHTTTLTTQPTSITAGQGREEEKLILRSFPLGYVPPNPHAAAYMIIKDTESYQSLKPIPIPNPNCANVDGATEEILSNWSSKSLTKGEHPCRKIVFTIKSHDQGWGGQRGQQGGYEGSFTWLEAGLEKMTAYRERELPRDILTDKEPSETPEVVDVPPFPEFELDGGLHRLAQPWAGRCILNTIIPPLKLKTYAREPDAFQHDLLPPSKLTIQRNTVATRNTPEHQVTWLCSDNVIPDSLEAAQINKQGRGKDSANGEFVRNLKLGDVITVWGKARFPGWVNHVNEVKIDVYWAV